MTLLAPIILGDWGNSHLRLYLYRDGEILADAHGPGVGALNGRDPGDILLALIAGWRAGHEIGSVTLCGAIGSNLGWREVPYLDCPSRPGEFPKGVLRFEAGGLSIAIAPGLACINPCGAPDVLRGEETQIAGAMRIDSGLAIGEHLLCLPGTHTKWVHLSEGRIENFLTSMTGELFALLDAHSMILRGGALSPDSGADAFDAGLARAGAPCASLVHTLFEARSRRLREGMSIPTARSLVSGLLIGSDSAGALASYPELREIPVRVIGAQVISDLYARSLRARGVEPVCHDGAQAVRAGLSALHEALPWGIN